jgi:hypothetical protein
MAQAACGAGRQWLVWLRCGLGEPADVAKVPEVAPVSKLVFMIPKTFFMR